MASNVPRYSIDSLSPLSPSPTRSEYPFPRQGSSTRYQPRRGSTASSIHSIGGTLDTAAHSHGLGETGRNAISTLLQPPIVRTGLIPHTSAPASSAHKPPTARDIPPVTLTNIPYVDPSEFKPYLTQVSALYDILQRAKESVNEVGPQFHRRGSRVDEFSDLLEKDRSNSNSGVPSLSRQASLTSLTPSTETPGLKRKSSSGPGRRAAHVPTPLSTIPTVYFEADFHLENPRTFDVVSERSEVVKPAPGSPDVRRTTGQNGSAAAPRKALATNAILQEKLSWYMDTIEIHLITSISTASTSFFAALGSLRDLHSEAADSVDRIKVLRKELQSLDHEMAVGGLNIVKLKRRRENLKQLSSAVRQLKAVVDAVKECESMVDDGEVELALDAIDNLEKVIAGQSSIEEMELRDLRGAVALQGVDDDLDTLRLRIGYIYETRFLGALMGDLRRHVESLSAADTLQRWSSVSKRSRGGHSRDSSILPTYHLMNDDFRAELLSNLSGLNRARYIAQATNAYRESVLREVRNTIRRPLPSSNDDDAESVISTSTLGSSGKQKTQQEKSSALARNLRALDPEDAEALLKKTYISIGETLRRVGTQTKILLDITSTLGVGSSTSSPPRLASNIALDERLGSVPSEAKSARNFQEEMHQALDISNLIGQAVDIAQDKIVKVLRVRSEQSTHLSVENFLRYFTLNLLFANECEAVSGRSGTVLKNVVNGQIKEFIQNMSESERQSLASEMEADPWNAKDFKDTDSDSLSQMLSASTQDAEAWTLGSKPWLATSQSTLPLTSNEPSLVIGLGIQTNGASGTSTPSKTTTRPAHIESESFLLTASAVRCLHGLTSFLHLITGLPSMMSEIAPQILSYLTLFNSRCTQLILGAGATKSAGLKNITTKHLALAAQALSFISALIPHVREFIRRHLGHGTTSSTLMGDFDKVRRAYLEHQQSIYDKLVDIMAGRATARIKAMKSINWEKDTSEVSPYMETLCQETTTLYRVLNKHLPSGTVQMIMHPVFASYKEQWGKAYADVVVTSLNAKNRLLKDVEYFKSRIGAIDGAGDLGDYLVRVVNEMASSRTIAKASTPALTANPSIRKAIENSSVKEPTLDANPNINGHEKISSENKVDDMVAPNQEQEAKD